ncbi:CU044_5270 family protein [Actinomadura rifamycini]|uniref:CU044_5270 family protein n=1 Tax=Actinomadura rifamycini TaxID=31962 RepID=UPI00041212A0|nr:CU044_5270 family protein [Actinomadura rifamycini]
MNDLDPLKSFRRATPPITPAAADAARDRLRAAWTAPPREPRRAARPVRSPRWLVSRAAAAAALGIALTAGIGIAQNTGDPRAGTQIANAAVLGERAARAAEDVPFAMPRADQWIYVKIRAAQFKGDMNTWWLGMDAGKTHTVERWERVDGRARAEFIDGDLEVRSPQRREDLQGDVVGYSFPGPDMHRVVKELPTEPDALLRALYDPDTMRIPDDPDAPGGQQPRPDDRAVFRTVADLLRRPLPPELRAALYRALPRIPGVSVRTDAADAAGRHGVAFFGTFGGWAGDMIILDPETYRYLGTRSFATRAHAQQGEGTVEKGTLLELTAQLEMRVVDEPGARR